MKAAMKEFEEYTKKGAKKDLYQQLSRAARTIIRGQTGIIKSLKTKIETKITIYTFLQAN